MEIKRLDASQFLLPNEKVELKAERKKDRSSLVQLVICYLFLLIVLSGDCFFITIVINAMQEVFADKGVNTELLPLSIILAVVHLVPFVFWFVLTMQKKTKNDSKWYVLTNKRLCIVTSTKTLEVVSVWFNQITSLKVDKKAVHVNINEERITLDKFDSASTFGAKLESLLAEENDRQEGNVEPEIHVVKAEENIEAPIKANEPVTVEQQEEKKVAINENVTAELDKILQNFASEVLKDEEHTAEGEQEFKQEDSAQPEESEKSEVLSEQPLVAEDAQSEEANETTSENKE